MQCSFKHSSLWVLCSTLRRLCSSRAVGRNSSIASLRSASHISWQHGTVCTSVREYVFFVFFQISKKTWLFTFFLNDVSKSRKSHQQKFSPQYATKEWSLRSMITVIQFLAPVYVHSNLKLLHKLQSLDYQEANVEWERWAVSDSDSSEEEQ